MAPLKLANGWLGNAGNGREHFYICNLWIVQ